ncbi:MAG: hypothetical protein KatS3mg015_1764 [Fimbriimonadales bacterium]|nr:MAG: hypothetical protein KatS3mg015_1764 [Fimbriimonadales bacterium]
MHPFFDWNADGKDVDYVLKMRNTTGYALTMAPAFVLDDGKAGWTTDAELHGEG